MKIEKIITSCLFAGLATIFSACGPDPAPIIEHHDVTVVQPKPKPAPVRKPVVREKAPEEFRAVTTPN